MWNIITILMCFCQYRVMSTAPYNLNKKSEDAQMPNSMGANISATTSTANMLVVNQG